jgi:type I restriction enzyme S subunit
VSVALRLRDVGSTYSGLTGKTGADFGNGDASFVTFLEVINNTRLRGRQLERVRVAKGERQNRVMRGDLLFNGSSETPDEVALSAVVDFDPDGSTYLNSFCFGYRLQTAAKLDPAFLAYFFRSGAGRALVASLAQGATRYNIAKTKFLDIELTLPSPQRQREITAALSDVDDHIAALERMIAKKEAIKLGMMQQLLTGHTRLPGFTEPWAWRPFADVMTRLNAKQHQIPASRYSEVGRLPVVDQGQAPVVGYTNDITVAFDPGDDGVLVFGDHTCITKFVDFKFAVGADGTQILKAKPGNSSRFLSYVLTADPVASTGYNRHFKFLRERVLPVPSVEEQCVIADTIGDVDAEIGVLHLQLAKTCEIKQGMMQKLLAGRTRLPAMEPGA